MDKLRVGIAGLGTVGSGVVKLLQKNKDIIAKRCGKEIEITAVSAKNKNKDRGLNLDGVKWVDSPAKIASMSDVDVVVELIGGETTAKQLCEETVVNKKHLVSANKALISKCGMRLSKLAANNGVQVSFEPAVAGGIPVLKAIREGLAGNKITSVMGILNGTCNYILTTMEKTGREFEDVLKEAQDLGYAEADPSFDVEGIDTAHKLAILSSLAFNCKLDLDSLYVEGIEHITALDIKYADELGYNIKLLGITKEVENGIEQRVHPVLVGKDLPIAQVDGAFNAVVIEGDAIGKLVLEGPGAGEMATASAVVADIVDIARGSFCYPFNDCNAEFSDIPLIPMDKVSTSYYMRIPVIDKPGVLSKITKIFGEENISIESVLQKAADPNNPVDLILTTHETSEISVKQAVEKLEELDVVLNKPNIIRKL